MPVQIDGSPLRKALKEGRHALGVQMVMPSAHVARIVAGVAGLTVGCPYFPPQRHRKGPDMFE